MNLRQARAALSSLFSSVWGATTPITWDGTLPPTPGTAFVRFTVQETTSKLDTWTGSEQHWRFYGIACVQIFVRSGSGTAQSDDLTQLVRFNLMGKRINAELSTYEATVHDDGPDGHGWDQTRVLVRFQYTQTTT
jgi:hypothetical protein